MLFRSPAAFTDASVTGREASGSDFALALAPAAAPTPEPEDPEPEGDAGAQPGAWNGNSARTYCKGLSGATQ